MESSWEPKVYHSLKDYPWMKQGRVMADFCQSVDGARVCYADSLANCSSSHWLDLVSAAYDKVLDMKLEDKCDNACQYMPCMNGGSCRTAPDSYGYTCDCLPGFTGETCRDGM